MVVYIFQVYHLVQLHDSVPVLFPGDEDRILPALFQNPPQSPGQLLRQLPLRHEGRGLEPEGLQHQLHVFGDEHDFACFILLFQYKGQLVASCPRHLWFHPNRKWAYINTEYTSTIIGANYDEEAGTLAPFQVVSSLPDTYFDVKTMTSELVVHPNGKWLYISNRRHNSLGAFSIDQENGRMTPINWVNCGGKKPRFFAVEPGGQYLFNGNQSSDTITVFRINPETGALEDTKKVIDTPTPVWMLFTGSVPSVEGL